MTDEELKDLVASLAVSQKELTERQKRTDEQLEKITKKLDRLDVLIGNESNSRGNITEEFTLKNIYNSQEDIVEEFFFQNFIKNPVLGNITFNSVSRNLNNHRGDLHEEYDLVLANSDTVAVIEIKAKAHVNDLEQMINQKMLNFPKLFKLYKDYHYYAGVATLVTNDVLIKKAQELGLFLLTQQGDHTAIVQTGRLLH